MIVAGGGIGGLAAAIAVSDAGCEVTVIERVSEPRPLGAGLSLWPNGVRALRDLGAAGWIEGGGAPVGDGGIRKARDGSLLASTSPELLQERYGEPLVLVHRAACSRPCWNGSGRSGFASEPEVISAHPEGRVGLDSGESLDADAVIGADGIDSAVRESILRDGRRRLGHSRVPGGDRLARRGAGGRVLGPRRGVRHGAALERAPVLVRGRSRELQRLREPRGPAGAAALGLREWAEPIPAVLAATDPAALLRHELRDRKPSKRWGEGRVTLLGDAAHPMLPFLGQGACVALEDAVALGRALGGSPDAEDSLRAYERERIGRARMMVKGSRAAAHAALASGPSAAIRDWVSAALPESLRLRQLDRLIGRPT